LQLIIGNASLDNIFYLLERNAEAIQSVLKNSLSLITNSSITVIGNIGSTITQSMLVIIMSFLMSLERKAIGKFLLEVIPSKFHQYIRSRFHSTQKIIGHWMK
jgi:predicted PurR-regulated permease PerM